METFQTEILGTPRISYTVSVAESTAKEYMCLFCVHVKRHMCLCTPAHIICYWRISGIYLHDCSTDSVTSKQFLTLIKTLCTDILVFYFFKPDLSITSISRFDLLVNSFLTFDALVICFSDLIKAHNTSIFRSVSKCYTYIWNIHLKS